MPKWLLSILVILVLFQPQAVHAQDPVTFSSIQVQISPEYDQPGVLVIYDMTLSANPTNPVTLSVQIPTVAGEPNAVAARQADGLLYDIQSTRKVVGNWSTITFTTTTPEIRLEYYDPNLDKQGTTRHYQYEWPGDYAVTQFIIQVQQPFDATNMSISPSLGPGETGSDGLTYYTQDIGSVPAGQTITITIGYQKSTDTLTAQNLPVQPSAAIPQSIAPDLNVSTWLPWVVGILGAALIIGGIIWFWQSGRQKSAPQTRRRRSRSGLAESRAATDQNEAAIYCSQCGKRALPRDVFCRYCGTRIHSK